MYVECLHLDVLCIFLCITGQKSSGDDNYCLAPDIPW